MDTKYDCVIRQKPGELNATQEIQSAIGIRMEPLPLSFLPHVDELLMEYLLFRGFTKVSIRLLYVSVPLVSLEGH